MARTMEEYAGRVRWKSTLEEYMVARENAQGPPCSACRRSSHDVDAAGCKSVGDDGGTWDIFTNCHLFVCKRISAIYRPSVCWTRYLENGFNDKTVIFKNCDSIVECKCYFCDN